MNMYDSPAQAQFLNTYVPIPFEQLFQLGTQAKQDVQNTIDRFGGQLEKWSEFTSPSEVDTQRWYDETVGRAKPIIEEMSSNMDLLKTPEGRSRLQSVINNANYPLLSQLQQSKKGLEERQKVNQQLMLNNRYNPLWHDVDFTGYNTAKSKIFNDINPLAYTSIKDLSDPYFDQLSKDKRFLKHAGLYDIYGVEQADLERIADQKVNDIYNTPYAQKNIEVARENGIIPEGVSDKEWLRENIIQSQQERIKTELETNPFALTDYKTSAQYSARGGANGAFQQSRSLEIVAGAQMKTVNALKSAAKVGGYQLDSEENIGRAYKDVYADAFSKEGGKAKQIMQSMFTQIEPSEVIASVYPIDTKQSSYKISVDKGESKPAMRFPLAEGAILLNRDQVPVEEIPEAYLKKYELSFKKEMTTGLGDVAMSAATAIPTTKRKEQALAKRNTLSNYATVNQVLLSAITEKGVYQPDPSSFVYGSKTGNRLMNSGKVYISRKVIEKAFEDNKESFGDLSVDSAMDMFFNSGLGEAKNHLIGKRVDGKVRIAGEDQKIDDVDGANDMLEINVAIPLFQSPAQTKSFDAQYARKTYGTKGATESEEYQDEIAYPINNSNM